MVSTLAVRLSALLGKLPWLLRAGALAVAVFGLLRLAIGDHLRVVLDFAGADGPLAVVLSMIPFTAASTTVMRLAIPNSAVPPWQIGLSLGVLLVSVWLVLTAAARIFRIGLLMYGKSPTLPEILRWARTK